MACSRVDPRPRRTWQRLHQSGDWDKIDGVWTSGMDSQVVDAVKAAKKRTSRIVGAGPRRLAAYLQDGTGYPGLVGAAVTNTAASVVPASLWRSSSSMETRSHRPGVDPANTLLLKPVLADNQTDAASRPPVMGEREGLNPIGRSRDHPGLDALHADQASRARAGRVTSLPFETGSPAPPATPSESTDGT